MVRMGAGRTAGLPIMFPDYDLRRRRAANPARPRPIKASEAGSGTEFLPTAPSMVKVYAIGV
jgi:hypothetical protein